MKEMSKIKCVFLHFLMYKENEIIHTASISKMKSK